MNILQIETCNNEIMFTSINTNTKQGKGFIIYLEELKNYISLIIKIIHESIDLVFIDLGGYGLCVKDRILAMIQPEDIKKIIDYKTATWRIWDEI